MRVPDGMISSRRSRRFYADAVPDPQLRARYANAARQPAGYGWMLVEDVKASLLPSPGHHPWRAEFAGPGATRAMALVTASDPHGGDLTRMTHRLFGQAAGLLLTAGEATYEAELLRRTSEPDMIAAVRLHLILPGSFERRGNDAVQVLPEAWAPGGFVLLDPALLVEFRLDDDMRNTIGQVFAFLAEIDKTDGRMAALMQSSLTGRLDVQIGSLLTARRRLLAAATAQVGWDGRGSLNEDALDPYLAWRHLKFLEFRASLRDSLLHQANVALQRLAVQAGADTKLILADVPSVAQVRQAQQDVVSGKRPLSELIHFAISQEDHTQYAYNPEFAGRSRSAAAADLGISRRPPLRSTARHSEPRY